MLFYDDKFDDILKNLFYVVQWRLRGFRFDAPEFDIKRILKCFLFKEHKLHFT